MASLEFLVARAQAFTLLSTINDGLLKRALEAGARQIQPPTDMFYGASTSSLRDPFGHVWVLLSWKEDIDPAEMERRGNALLSREPMTG